MPGDIDTAVRPVGGRGLFGRTVRGERAETADARTLALGEYHGILYPVHELVLEGQPPGTAVVLVIVYVVIIVVWLPQQIIRVDVALENRTAGRRCGVRASLVVIGRRGARRTTPVPFPVEFAGRGGRRARHTVLPHAFVRVLGHRGVGRYGRSRSGRGHGCRGGRHAEVLAAQERAARLVADTATAAVAHCAAGIALVQPTVRVPHGLGQRAAGRHAVVLGRVVWCPVPVVIVTVTERAVAVRAGHHRARRRGRHRSGRLLEAFEHRYGRGHRRRVSVVVVENRLTGRARTSRVDTTATSAAAAEISAAALRYRRRHRRCRRSSVLH